MAPCFWWECCLWCLELQRDISDTAEKISHDALRDFMEEKKVNGPSDYQKKQTVDQQVITDIAAFILENE